MSGPPQKTGDKCDPGVQSSSFDLIRILVNKPEWIDSCCYCFFECLFLGPVYRLLFWLTVKTVTVNIVKTFDTEGTAGYGQQYSETGVNAYKNNLEGFDIKRFRGGNGPAEERDALGPEFQMMVTQPRERWGEAIQQNGQREFDV